MKRKLEISELIFRILAYTFLTVFALLCLYPFLYAVSASISGRHAVEYQELILLPKNVQFEAFQDMFGNNQFWNAYSPTAVSPSFSRTSVKAVQPWNTWEPMFSRVAGKNTASRVFWL